MPWKTSLLLSAWFLLAFLAGAVSASLAAGSWVPLLAGLPILLADALLAGTWLALVLQADAPERASEAAPGRPRGHSIPALGV